jgi:hypothetical protein
MMLLVTGHLSRVTGHLSLVRKPIVSLPFAEQIYEVNETRMIKTNYKGQMTSDK